MAHQVLSWRRAGGERRQQLKWLASGAAVAVFSILLGIGIGSVVPLVGLAALPAAIGLAILKYRLYDIDRLISRTLAYAIITGLLVGVYASLVLLATQLLHVHTPVAVAASTLAVAALFNPLRLRVQHVVDRRFNRARYDADQTVAAFAARLQDAVELDWFAMTWPLSYSRPWSLPTSRHGSAGVPEPRRPASLWFSERARSAVHRGSHLDVQHPDPRGSDHRASSRARGSK